jgi:ancient ubiquitous protein 1
MKLFIIFHHLASECIAFSHLVFAVDRFSSWPFCLSNAIQPLTIGVSRPPFADVAVTGIAAGVWTDVFWFVFVPCTIFTIR